MFDLERLIEDCRAAVAEDPSPKAVREVLARAVAEPAAGLKALGEPQRGEVKALYRSNELTLINVIWAPWMTVLPHNHHMWAVIGIYTGREENTFFRRNKGGLTQHGTKVMEPKDTTPLGASIIHAVANPLDKITGALHVYGGDFFATPRSEWDPKTFEEHPYDVEHTMRAFEASNALLRD